MKTAIITGPGQIEIREVDVPAVGVTQVLVRTRAVGLCTLEQRFFRGTAPEGYPFQGGHEVSGEVVEIGRQASTQAQPGDVVCLALRTRCGSCYYCRRGMDNLCSGANEERAPGTAWGPAGLSEYVLAEDYQVYVPEQAGSAAVDLRKRFATLALAEPVACVVRSVQTPPLRAGDIALVQGAGIMGLLHVHLLRLRGVRVMVAEPDPERRRIAGLAGAECTFDPRETGFVDSVRDCAEGRGVNAAFFTAGGPAAIEQAAASLAKGGWLCLYGSVHPTGPIQMDPNVLHYNELVVTGTFSHTRASFQQAVALISSGLVDVGPYVSEQVDAGRVTYAFERAISADTYRIVVTYGMSL
ncbi:MAG: zinc-binding dehydrogenase [Chloroflexi bacterium]|nr:zinc-binding dehydrogenase [Chloroflexota bacterium]